MISMSRQSSKRYLKLIATITIVYFIYENFYCSLIDRLFNKTIPHLDDNLPIHTIGSSSLSKDLIMIMTPKLSKHLIQRLKSLDLNFSDNFTTPLMILYSNHIHENDFINIAKQIQRQMMFMDISSIFNLFPLNFDTCRTKSSWWRRGKWNYHLMIRFWFKILFQLSQLKHYEYIMRLDDDSQIENQWINVFHEMRLQNAVYFANNQDVDLEKSLPGLIKLQYMTLKYILLNNITIQQPEMIRNGFNEDYIRNYFNNFEVMKMEFFRRPNVQQWIEEIDRTNGIFKYRWGDATLRYITLAIFAQSNEILHRQQYNLSYCHKC